MASRGKIVTLGANVLSTPVGNFGAKGEYVCANAHITQGVTSTPASLEECLSRFPGISAIANAVGVTSSASLWSFPGVTYGPQGVSFPTDLYLGTASNECIKIKNNASLGPDFYGCLWGLPEAPFNCSCPELGSKFEAYIKHRLNIATFWNTPKTAVVKRREFLDSLKYAVKLTLNIAGDLSIRSGDIVEMRANNSSGYPYYVGASIVNGMYYVTGVKHVFTNSGTHETQLTVTGILPPSTVTPSNPNNNGNNTQSGWNDILNIPNNPGFNDDPFLPRNNENWS